MTMAFFPPFTTVSSKLPPSRTATCALAIPRIAERIKASVVERAMESAAGCGSRQKTFESEGTEMFRKIQTRPTRRSRCRGTAPAVRTCAIGARSWDVTQTS